MSVDGATGMQAPLSEDALRVSDAERRAIVDALSRHTADGRLRLDEFEDRSSQALAATTRGDLKGLLGDLPALDGPSAPATAWAGAPQPMVAGAPQPMVAGAPRSYRMPPGAPQPMWEGPPRRMGACAPRPARMGRPPHRHPWAGRAPFLFVSLLLIAIWLMSGAGYFWPMWAIVPMGIGALCSGGKRHHHDFGPTPPSRT